MAADVAPGANHPLAKWMALIAFLGFNVGFGGLYGTFSILLPAVEARLGVGRELSSLGIPIASVMIAVLAPVVGVLTGRLRLRTLMVAGSVMLALGNLLLAAARTVPMNLLAYVLLIGPGLCIVSTVVPATLVTRWFVVNRGRALGLVYIPIGIAAMPLIANAMLHAYGLSSVYILVAVLSAVLIVPMLFIVDAPPGLEAAEGAVSAAGSPEAAGALSVGDILRLPQFWTATLAFAGLSGGAVLLSAHLVPMATGWGIASTRAATLVAIMSFAGMAGTPFFGWLADRVGGRNALAIAAIDSVFLWGLLLVATPPFLLVLIVVALIGFHGGGIVPAFTMTLSQRFGAASFSRAYGLGNLASLPVTTLIVPAAAAVFVRTGSYAGALAGEAGLLLVAAVLLIAFASRRRAAG